MAGSTKPCLFCGRVGVKLTQEDVYPLWLRKALHIRGDIIYTSAKVRVASVLEVRLGGVCAKCNNEWLSHLEGSFAPLMTAAMNGFGPLRLTRPDQVLVALWAAKTWLLLEKALTYLRGDSVLEPPADYFRWMREHSEPPPHTQVWIGAVAAHESQSMVSFLATQWVGNPPEPPVGIAGIFTIGDVLFQVYTPARPAGSTDPIIYTLGLKGDLASVLRPIWPATEQEVLWPPPTVLGPDDLAAIWPSQGIIQPGSPP